MVRKDVKAEQSGHENGQREDVKTQVDVKTTESVKSESVGVSFLSALAVIAFNVLCILSLCFMYSFSAFKLDLKKHMGWDENQLNTIFMLATVGQNFVVHLGLFCDRCGCPGAFVLSAALKSAGLFGMWYLTSKSVNNPWVFGLCFFLDAQGMSGGLIIAMKEMQRACPAKMSGIMASLSNGAFGMSAAYMTALYDYFFRPDVSMHILSAAIQSLMSLLLCALTVSILLPRPRQKVTIVLEKDSSEEEELPVMFTILSEPYSACFLGMLVCWGGGIVWNANMGSFATAAGHSLSAQKHIRSYFYAAGSISSLCVGPLADLGGLQIWYAFTALFMYLSGVVMLISDGKMMVTAAIMAGGAFGSIATLCPMMSKRLSFTNMGTLYALAKFAGMLSGISWNYHAAIVAQGLTKPGESNCVGEDCYRQGWVLILGTQAPFCIYLLYWAAKSMVRRRPKKSKFFVPKKKVEDKRPLDKKAD